MAFKTKLSLFSECNRQHTTTEKKSFVWTFTEVLFRFEILEHRRR